MAEASKHPRGARQRVDSSRTNDALRVLAALIGTLPAAVLASAALSRFLPVSEPLRFTIGFGSAFLLWAAGICWVFLVRRAVVAWALCVGVGGVLGAVVWGVPL